MKGKPLKITVDDYILTNNGKVFHADVSDYGAFWVPILEKAYAKMNVNYANIDGGRP